MHIAERHIIIIPSHHRLTQPFCLNLARTGQTIVKYLLSLDWSEPRLGLVGSWETSHAFLFPRAFENSTFQPATLSSSPFLSAFHPCLSHISSHVAIVYRQLPMLPFFVCVMCFVMCVCVCVSHTNMWHYDMMAQCSVLNFSHQKIWALFDPGVKTEQHTISCPLLNRKKLLFMQHPRLPHAGLSVNHGCSLILMRHNFELMVRDDDNCERRLTSDCD